MRLIFATNNNNKVKEIRSALSVGFEIITLHEAGIYKDIPEPHDTLEANASEKSKVIFELTGKNCFSEDTGLEVVALKGEPGVKSARYIDGEPQYTDIIEKLLVKMEGITDRRARFRTVISVMIDGHETLFEGICNGNITLDRRGSQGFGYDPVFIPDNASRTFGEMELEEKKQYSHRAKAFEKMIQWLKQRDDK